MNQYVVHLPISFKGWIMEGIARDSSSAIGISPRFHFFAERKMDYLNLPVMRGLLSYKKSKVHIFMHHKSFLKYSKKVTGKKHLFLTHFENPDGLSAHDWSEIASADRVITQNSEIAALVLRKGGTEETTHIGYGGVSRMQYFPQPHFKLRKPFVLIVGHCKPRKNPKFLEQVILASPYLNFVIHGTDWLNYIFINKLPPRNLEVLEFNRINNPAIMREASVLLSLASNEGGPFPVIEALASGTPVVATPTGFCPDLICEGKGFLLSPIPSCKDVQSAIEKAIELKNSVATQDLLNGKLSWGDLGSILYLETVHQK